MLIDLVQHSNSNAGSCACSCVQFLCKLHQTILLCKCMLCSELFQCCCVLQIDAAQQYNTNGRGYIPLLGWATQHTLELHGPPAGQEVVITTGSNQAIDVSLKTVTSHSSANSQPCLLAKICDVLLEIVTPYSSANSQPCLSAKTCDVLLRCMLFCLFSSMVACQAAGSTSQHVI